MSNATAAAAAAASLGVLAGTSRRHATHGVTRRSRCRVRRRRRPIFCETQQIDHHNAEWTTVHCTLESTSTTRNAIHASTTLV